MLQGWKFWVFIIVAIFVLWVFIAAMHVAIDYAVAQRARSRDVNRLTRTAEAITTSESQTHPLESIRKRSISEQEFRRLFTVDK
jgi:hypothetical protein